MSKSKSLFVIVALVFAILAGYFYLADAKARAAIGQPAPAFSATDSNGKTHSLADYKGKFVVMEWTNNDCPFVKKHYSSNNMQTLQKTYGEKGVVWLSVISSAPGKQGHVDGKGANELTQSRGASPAAVLLDSDGSVGKAFGARTTPHMFIINPEGALIYAGAIDSNDSADPADISSAQNYVVAALGDAMANKPVTTPVTRPYGCSVKY